MASIASAALEGRRNGRVLMLGLGGGTIAADIMMSEPIDWSLQVTCVEADEDTAEAARLYFLPLMFEHANAMGGGAGACAGAGAENMLRRLHVVTADAMRCRLTARDRTTPGPGGCLNACGTSGMAAWSTEAPPRRCRARST